MAQIVLVVAVFCLAAAASVVRAEEKAVSYLRQIAPIFKRNCNGCHYPGKLKGDLDLTSYPSILKGGKHGPTLKPGDLKAGTLLKEISGSEPSMPKEGEPLSEAELALIATWIRQGAPDDTPKTVQSLIPAAPPKYRMLPVVTALAYSPDGRLLAVSGSHEVLLYSAETLELTGRLLGEATRIENIVFSPDGKQLAVAGNAPGVFGQVQIWDVQNTNLLRTFKVSNDSIYGLSWSPQGDKVAVGGADRFSRVCSVRDGKEISRFENHSDWVFGTAFTADGKRYVSASRDKSMKLVEATSGQHVDELNKQTEAILCLARHPGEEIVVFGSEQGMVRAYKIAENPNRGSDGKDPNFIKEAERLSGPAHVVAFSPDGTLLGAGGSGNEVKLYSTKDWKRVATLRGHDGAIFALSFHSKSNLVATGGFDGKIRFYETTKGKLLNTVPAVPLESASQTAAR